MYAMYRYTDGVRTHQWPMSRSAKQDGDDVVIDGYRIEGATLESVISDREYYGDEIYSRHFENDGLLARIRGWF